MKRVTIQSLPDEEANKLIRTLAEENISFSVEVVDDVSAALRPTHTELPVRKTQRVTKGGKTTDDVILETLRAAKTGVTRERVTEALEAVGFGHTTSYSALRRLAERGAVRQREDERWELAQST